MSDAAIIDKMKLNVLGKILSAIKPLVQAGKYEAAGRTATDFIKMAYYLESKEDVFLGEVLEGVCLQLAEDLEAYEISKEDRETLTTSIAKHLDIITASYAKGVTTHDMLVDIRYDATIFQFVTARVSPARLARPLR